MKTNMKAYSFLSQDEKDKENFVLDCEKSFEKQLADAVDEIEKSGKRIITLSGPTCSGKTTAAKRFISKLERNGKKTGVISIDDYYYARVYLEMRAEEKGEPVDFDSVETIDLDYLSTCVRLLLAGETFKVPQFDFATGFRHRYKYFDPDKYDYYLFEGIQAIYPEITSLFSGNYISAHICVANDVEVNGVKFTSREIRLMRRLVRDFKFRAASPESTFEMWDGVASNEDRHIIPFAGNCDIQIDSYLSYEPFMMRKEITSLLLSMPENEHSNIARSLVGREEKLFDIDKKYLPSYSVFREFMDDPKK